MTADLICALRTAKYMSRIGLGVRKVTTDQAELLELLNRHMILAVLDDPACLEELTDDEVDTLEGALILKS
jgi:hypothetical protein